MKPLAPGIRGFVIQAIRAELPDARVLAFGSRVHGEAKQYSDLDIAVDAGFVIPFPKLAMLRERFSESDLPFKVDLVDYQSVTAEFRAIIDQTAEHWSSGIRHR